jgi:16S rRNA (uracil1498-N3)-methyltransferase
LNLFYQPRLSEGHLLLDEDESQHAIKVLRHQPGDEIPVTDGKGTLYFCVIDSVTRKACSLKIIRTENKARPSHHIHIALAPTKSADRMEWFVEKATEIGIQQITFIQTQRSERPKINLERMNKAAIAAIKQSGQVWLPVISGLTDFKTILSNKAKQKFIAHLEIGNSTQHLFRSAQPAYDYLVLIGPEGDFSAVEISEATKAGFSPISLGASTLRTETAAITACHTLNLLHV